MCIGSKDPFITSLSTNNLPTIKLRQIDEYPAFQTCETKVALNKRMRMPSFETTPKKKFFDRSMFSGKRVGSISVARTIPTKVKFKQPQVAQQEH
jgi:hypothetical protein